MEKTIIFSTFILLFIYLIKKDIVYVIPMIFLFFSNINGLLDWEDFAKHGSVKFPDYGLILSILTILYIIFYRSDKADSVSRTNNGLIALIYFHLFYYLFLFFYSVVQQGSIEWPVKIGRTYFYGISIVAFYFLLAEDPIEKFKKVTNFLKIYTIIFSILYVIYNYFNINFYANEPFEVIDNVTSEVTRNFAAFPYFLMYFYCVSSIDFFNNKGNNIVNLLLILLYLICMISVMTRGLIISAAIIFIIAYLLSENRIKNLLYIFIFFGLGVYLLNAINFFETGNFLVLLERSQEITDSGIGDTGNFAYRTEEFLNILNNVIQYNPFFGFGFVNTDLMGFNFNIMTAGSPDNGFTNLLGISGFLGLFIFLMIILKWGILNLKLQRLKIDNYSKAHFLFICSIFLSWMNGSTHSYLESFGLFLIYDLLIYRKYSKYKKWNEHKNSFLKEDEGYSEVPYVR